MRSRFRKFNSTYNGASNTYSAFTKATVPNIIFLRTTIQEPEPRRKTPAKTRSEENLWNKKWLDIMRRVSPDEEEVCRIARASGIEPEEIFRTRWRCMRSMYANGKGVYNIGRYFGIEPGNVYQVCKDVKLKSKVLKERRCIRSRPKLKLKKYDPLSICAKHENKGRKVSF
jgi:hypothetical protein